MTQIHATVVADARLDALKQQLDDPRVAAAISQLLDHADLLALLVSGLDTLIRRSETVSDSVIAGLNDLRTGAAAPMLDLASIGQLTASLTTLAKVLAASTPALERLIESDLVAPATVDTVALAGRALAAGHARAQQNNTTVSGIRAALKLLKDPDIARGLGLLSEVARGLGQELNRTAPGTSDRAGL